MAQEFIEKTNLFIAESILKRNVARSAVRLFITVHYKEVRGMPRKFTHSRRKYSSQVKVKPVGCFSTKCEWDRCLGEILR